jgi:hypothetical protein
MFFTQPVKPPTHLHRTRKTGSPPFPLNTKKINNGAGQTITKQLQLVVVAELLRILVTWGVNLLAPEIGI